MIKGLGLDVTELDRIAKVYERHGGRFLDKILTPAEREALPKQAVPYLAARFAAKEAGAKALGTGFRQGITYRHFQVEADSLGKPVLRLIGPALDRARTLGATRWHLSLTHGRDVAAAVVILEDG
jgi:holo-[acyl-carrier protein] synthase